MSATLRTPQPKSRISPTSPCSRVLISPGDALDRAPSSSPSPSVIPFPRVRTPSPTPSHPRASRRSPRPSSTHVGSSTCESPFEPRPSNLWLPNTSPRSPNHSPLTSQLHAAPLDIDLLSLVTPNSGPSSSGTTSATKHLVAPLDLGLTLDLDFNTTLGLDFNNSAGSSASTSAMSYATAGSPGGFLSLSPGEDVFSVRDTQKNGKSRRPNTEPPFEFTFSSSVDSAGAISHHKHARHESSDLSGSDTDQTSRMRPRSGSGSAQRNATSYGFAEQRYTRSSIPTPYYTAQSTPEPEAVTGTDSQPQAGPSHLPFLDTNITFTTPPPSGYISSPPFPLSGTDPLQSTAPASERPPSPAPTADFSMISPPSSPSFYQYSSQFGEDADADPFRSPHPRGTATLPFFRSNSTSVASGMPGAFHLSINGRTQSMSASMGLGPGMGKPRRVRPGISRLWESLASPAKGSPPLPPVSQDTHLAPVPTSRAKSTPMPGFSVVRGKTSPMMGVGRKLKERRRVKRPRRGALEVDADVDYGALDPLDGEEGELVGCTCTGWGDGACVCGYGYWDVYDYGYDHTHEPEPIYGGDSPPTPLPQLPPELFLQVLSYLPLRSVLAVASTCKAWRVLALDNGVWWGLWQAREGVPRVPNHIPNRNSDLGHRAHDSYGGLGRRYRGIKDEGVHGLMNTVEHEHDGEQWDESRGWTVDFDRANIRRKECARLGFGAVGAGVLMPSESRHEEGAQHSDAQAEEGDGQECELEQQEMMPSNAQPISRQAPLMLDWRKLYCGRSILEQRWREPEGEPRVLRIDGHKDSVYCLDFDSSRIVTGSRDRTIKVWCIKTGRCMATFEGHSGSVLCLKFERDWDLGSEGVSHGFMVSGSSDCTVCVWDLISTPITPGERSSIGDRPGKSKDGHPTAAAGSFGPPRKITAEIRKVLRGHSAGVLDLRMDERWIVTCSKDALMNVYDRKTLTLHTVLRGHEGPVNAVGLENGRVVSASGDGKMMLWDVETGKCVRVFEGHEKGLACIEFKDDLILSGSNDCTIKLWRASTGECLHTFAGHTLLVRALCFEPKTGYIVSTSYDKSVRVWEWREGPAEDGAQSQAGGSSEGSVQRKTKGVGRLVREFRNLHASHIFDVKFDVGKIVSTSHDQKIVVLDFSYGIEGAELFS